MGKRPFWTSIEYLEKDETKGKLQGREGHGWLLEWVECSGLPESGSKENFLPLNYFVEWTMVGKEKQVEGGKEKAL